MKTERVATQNDRMVWLAIAASLLGAFGILAVLRSARRAPVHQVQGRRPRVVILGGGFAGLDVARRLRNRATGRCEIVLIDSHNYQLFTPLLFQVATCGVDPYSITYPLRHYTDHTGVEFKTARVTNIDLDRRRIALQDLSEIGYDQLVIALGGVTDFFGLQSAQEHALPLKTVGDGIAIRNHLLSVLEKASLTEDPDERARLLTFVVVGGGATGVETAAALSELLTQSVPSTYPGIRAGEPRVVLIEASQRLLGGMHERMATKALERLRAKGVDVRLGARATEVRYDGVSTANDHRILARTVIWAAGIRVPDVVAAIDTRHGQAGSLVVDEFLQLPGRPGVYAIGDCADVDEGISHERVPWLAASAIHEARAAARNIAHAIDGRKPVAFEYREAGTLISLGRSDGIAQFGRLVLDGAVATAIWHLVHLAKIPTAREKISTVLDWSAGYVHSKDTSLLDLGLRPSGAQGMTGQPGESQT